MFTINVYKVKDNFEKKEEFAQSLANTFQKCTPYKVVCFIHEMENWTISDENGERNFINVQIFSDPGEFNIRKQLSALEELQQLIETLSPYSLTTPKVFITLVENHLLF